MRVIHGTHGRAVDALIARDAARTPAVERRVARIVSDVRRRGDIALREWTTRLDGWRGALVVSERTLNAQANRTPRDVRAALRLAMRHVERVAKKQVPSPFVLRVATGLTIEQRVRPLDHVGCYVPGGRYPLASTLVMTVVPARVAGVRNLTVACPVMTPAICFAALEAGATRVLRIGGAQAIAALAYGTLTIPRANKIVGPGNAWVAAAKALVSRDCAIDLHAGPSEILVWSDTGRPDWIAADLVAQAEHDPDASAVCVTTRPALARDVAAAVDRLAQPSLTARRAIARRGAVIVARSAREAAVLVNRMASEHVVCDDPHSAAMVTNAGTIFVGRWSAQAAGDYVTGSNHVLPTGGAARARGGLSAADFVRVTNVQTVSAAGLDSIGPSAIALAKAEGLTFHAHSIQCRLSQEMS